MIKMQKTSRLIMLNRHCEGIPSPVIARPAKQAEAISMTGSEQAAQSQRRDCFAPSGLAMTVRRHILIFCLGLFITVSFCAESFAAVDWNIKAPKALEEEDIIKREQPPEAAQRKDEVIRPKIEYNARGLKDPFRPLVMEKKVETAVGSQQPEVKSLPALTVQGLIWGGNFPQAIINNKVVKIGDAIGEVKITGITKEGVTVLFDNMEHKLPSPALTVPQQKEQK